MTEDEIEAIRARHEHRRRITTDFTWDDSDIAALLAEIDRMKQACTDADRAADEQIDGLQEQIANLRDQWTSALEEADAENERLRKVVADEVDRFDRECDRGDAARIEVKRLTAQRDRDQAEIASWVNRVGAVLALHTSPIAAHTCVICGDPWPCDTVRILRGSDGEEE